MAETAKGGAGQFAQSEGLEPRREQAKRDNYGTHLRGNGRSRRSLLAQCVRSAARRGYSPDLPRRPRTMRAAL